MLEERIREQLLRSAQSLNAQTRSRLTRARHAALESRSGHVAWWRQWVPAGALSAAALMVLLLVGQNGLMEPAGMANVANIAGGDDLELLADRDAWELAQDESLDPSAPGTELDYDFYDWAASTAHDEVGT